MPSVRTTRCSELNLVLLGPPGSGKGTQGERLQEDLHLPYYATGDILRAAVREETELGKKAKEYMDAGDLVPDELIVGVIAERIATAEAARRLHPRRLPPDDGPGRRPRREVRASSAATLSAAILIDVGEDEVIRRLGGRRTCVETAHIFHVEFDPPEKEGVCDVCGGELIVRDDDKPEVIRHRLETYAEKTEPLVERYETAGQAPPGRRRPAARRGRRGDPRATRDLADGGGGLVGLTGH